MINVQIQPLNLLKLTGIIFINTTVGYRQERGQCEKAVEVYLGQNFDFSNFLIATMKFSMMFATYPRVCHQINLLQREWKRSLFAKGARGISQTHENLGTQAMQRRSSRLNTFHTKSPRPPLVKGVTSVNISRFILNRFK